MCSVCRRMRWQDFTVPLPEAAIGAVGRTQVPLFVLGLSGQLKQFQLGVAAGFWATFYDCKSGYDYAVPEAMDFLHPTWSGLCLGNIINTAYVVLTFLQLRSPAEPIVVKGSAGTMTFNNAHGYCFPYGKLPYVVPSELQDEEEQAVKLGRVGDGLGTIVNGAVSSASWYSGCWDALRALGERVFCA